MEGKSEHAVGIRGRKPGVPNRTTKESRKAIAIFVEQNLPRLDLWLNQVAHGLPKVDREGEPIRDDAGSVVFVVRPDPAAAMKALSDIMEYHLPKLSRQDVSVTGLVASIDLDNLRPEDVAKLSLADLKTLALERMMNNAGNVIDVEAIVVEPLPSWLEPLK